MTAPVLTPCGTYAAATRHRRHGEPLCDPCRQAERAYGRKRRPDRRPPRPTPPCGTVAAYYRHRRRAEKACLPCLDALSAHKRAQAHARGVKPRQPAVCGTRPGYYRHRVRGEPACDACLEACAAYNRERRRRLREAAATNAA